MKGSNIISLCQRYHRLKILYEQIKLDSIFLQIHYKRDDNYPYDSKYYTSPLFRAVVCSHDGILSLLLQNGCKDEVKRDYILSLIDNERIYDLYFLQSYDTYYIENLLKRKLINLIETKNWKMLKKYIVMCPKTIIEEHLISKYYECPFLFSSRPSSNLLIQYYYNDEHHFQDILNGVDHHIPKEILLKMKTSHLFKVISRFPDTLDEFTDKEKVDCLVSSFCNMNYELSDYLVTRYANLFTHMSTNQYEKCNTIACGLGMYDIADKLCHDEQQDEQQEEGRRVYVENRQLLL